MARKIRDRKKIPVKKSTIIAFFVLSVLVVTVGIGLASRNSRIIRNLSKSDRGFQVDTLSPQSSTIPSEHNWKKYENTKLGYAISYPNNWEVEDSTYWRNEQDPLEVLVFRPKEIPARLSKVDNIDTDVVNLTIVAVLSIWPELPGTVSARTYAYEMTYPTKQNVLVNGVQGTKIEGESMVWDVVNNIATTEHRIVYIFPHNSNTVTFSFIPKPVNSREDYSALLPNMLQSIIIK